jgi:hypothetical protein
MTKNLRFKLSLDKAIEEFSGKSLKTIIEYIEERIKGKVPADFEPLLDKNACVI